jgi:hypothetical protein
MMPTAKAYTRLATITGSRLEVSKQRCNLATGAPGASSGVKFNSDGYDLSHREAKAGLKSRDSLGGTG